MAAKRRLTAEEKERLSTCNQPMFQTQVKAGSLFDETQPRKESFLAEFVNNQGILIKEPQPAIKKIRRFVDHNHKTIDHKKEEMFISALPDENGSLAQYQQPRQPCPNYTYADPQFQASSFGPWSQDLTLQNDRISRACPGRRRHAICEELDNTACLIRNRRTGSFNLGNISQELDMLTGSRKRKRSVIDHEEY